MRILILGGDGYLGWPLALKLSSRYPKAELILVDNLARRRMVAEVGGSSITPIAEPHARIHAHTRITGRQNLRFVELDVSSPDLERLISEVMPTHIYHMAQQASAPYSMRDVESAVFTLHNNEVGNMRLLWAVRKHVPHAHLIKLGSFGEYAKGGLDIAEGYFLPHYQGKCAQRPLPYPRESDDIYHISKINDTHYISMACRKWGLRVTDIMQCTIFGVTTEETLAFPELYTRLDYDAVFGTVVNRFIAQVVSGHAMTIYGTGLQRTGLMGLEDALGSMTELLEQHPEPGEHRVINHVTERHFCILELAESLASLAEQRGYQPRLLRNAFDPRWEQVPQKLEYEIEAHRIAGHVNHTPFHKVLAQTFDIVARFSDRIQEQVFPPEIVW